MSGISYNSGHFICAILFLLTESRLDRAVLMYQNVNSRELGMQQQASSPFSVYLLEYWLCSVLIPLCLTVAVPQGGLKHRPDMNHVFVELEIWVVIWCILSFITIFLYTLHDRFFTWQKQTGKNIAVPGDVPAPVLPAIYKS